MQQFLVALIVLACAAWLAFQVYRFFRPKSGGKSCGSCCDAGKRPAAAPPAGERVMMISSDDLRARVKARKS